MARIPTSDGLADSNLNALRGDPKSVLSAASSGAFGAGPATATAEAGQVFFNEAKKQRERTFNENKNAALNELGTMLPHEFDAAIDDERKQMQAGGKGFSQAVGTRLNSIFETRLAEALTKRNLRESDVQEIRSRYTPLLTRAKLSATQFEREEGRRQFVLDTEKQLEFLRLQVAKNPAKLIAVSQQVDGIITGSAEHLTPSQRAELKQKSLRALHLSAIDSLTQRSPGSVLANVRQGGLDDLVKKGVLSSKDVTVIRKTAERSVKRQTALAEAFRRKQFAKFRSDMEIGARRGETGVAEIEKAFEEGKITARDRTRYIAIADSVAERKLRLEASRGREDMRSTLFTADRERKSSPGLVRLARKEGAISASEENALLARIKKREDEIRQKEARYQSVLQSDKVPLDPKSSEDKKAVEEAYRRDIRGLVEEGRKKGKPGAQVIAEWVQGPKIMPETLVSRMRAGINSGNKATMAEAVDLYSRIVTRVPSLAEQFDKPMQAFMSHARKLMRAGVLPAKAVELAEVSVIKKNEAQIKERLRVFNAESTVLSGNLAVLQREFGRAGGFDTPVGRLFTASVGLNADIRADYNLLVKDFFLESGDLDTAREAALHRIKRLYGITRIGPTRMMKRPPEAEYFVEGAPEGWQKRQLLQEVRKNAILDKTTADNLEGRVILILAPTQLRAEKPGYLVQIIGPDSAARTIGDPRTGKAFLFRPDWATSTDRKRMVEQHKKEVRESIAEGKRKRERLIKNQKVNRSIGRQIRRAKDKEKRVGGISITFPDRDK